MHTTSKFFFFTMWLYLLAPELFLKLCLSQGYIQNFERNWENSICIRANNIARSLNYEILREPLQRKKLKLSKLEFYSLSGKDDFSIIHSIPFTAFEEQYLAQRFCKILERVTFQQ